MQFNFHVAIQARGLVETLLNMGFQDCIEQGYVWDNYDDVEYADFIKRNKLNFSRGAEKVCIYDDVTLPNWVIKINRGEFPSTACEREVRFYHAAEEAGLSEYFAEEYFIGTVQGYKIFLQERVKLDSDKIKTDIADSLKKSGLEYYQDIFDEFEWEDLNGETFMEQMSYIIDDMEDEEKVSALFPKNIATELINFLNKYHINDLHSGNYGYREDGQIVIFDYAGYHGGDSWHSYCSQY